MSLTPLLPRPGAPRRDALAGGRVGAWVRLQGQWLGHNSIINLSLISSTRKRLCL